jgi:HSP20 family protein
MIIRHLPNDPAWPSAVRGLEDMRREMDRLLESLSGRTELQTAGVFPLINVTEDDSSLRVRSELPGVERDDLEITMEQNTLTIAGERRIESGAEKVSYHRRERQGGRFRRSFHFPVAVNPDGVEARYANGILTVVLPKAPEARPRQITVQAS